MPPTLRKRTKKALPKISPHFPKPSVSPRRIRNTSRKPPGKIVLETSQVVEQNTLVKKRPRQKTAPKISSHFPKPERPPYAREPKPSTIPQPQGLSFLLLPAKFGLIQERISSSLYALIVQAILWNQTRGTQARPVLFTLLSTYPAPDDLALANVDDLAALLRPIGLHNTRAKRLIDMAKTWVAAPPIKQRRYRKLDYPEKGDGKSVGKHEVLGLDDAREGWEVAHLPGVGRYAIDSFRIFYRDELRGIGIGEDEVAGKDEGSDGANREHRGRGKGRA